jgi:hypothetical protein
MTRITIALLALSLFVLAGSAPPSFDLEAARRPPQAAEFYAAPSGTPDGDGSYEHPWDLATAFAHPPALQPGDTLWLRGGQYAGPFTSELVGDPDAPIIVRALPGVRAVLDGGTAYASTLQVNGAYVWYWGFEVMRSDPDRVTDIGGSSPPDLSRGHSNGVNVFGHHVRLINLIVHDDGEGFGFWTPAEDSEIYGSLVYNNGWLGPDRGHGHAIYTQNLNGTKRIYDNILFNQFSYGIHAYTEGGSIQGFDIAGNLWFNNGIIAGGEDTLKDNCLVGGLQPAARVALRENAGWAHSDTERSVRLGYDHEGNQGVTLLDNYFVGETRFAQPWQSITMNGNTFYSLVTGYVDTTAYPDNTYLTARPSGAKVILRPNQYEPGRAHIAIYNWDLAASVAVDVSSVLSPGTTYELRNAQDFWAEPVLAGTYTGSPLVVPMQALPAATPIGWPVSLTPTGPEFNVFVLLSGSQPELDYHIYLPAVQRE